MSRSRPLQKALRRGSDPLPPHPIAPATGEHRTELALFSRQDPDPERVSIFDRLRHRKVVQWMLAYLAAGWLILQLHDVLAEIWGWPIRAGQAVSLTVGLGIFPAVIVAWYHGEKGRQRLCCVEVAIVGCLVALIVYALRWTLS